MRKAAVVVFLMLVLALLGNTPSNAMQAPTALEPPATQSSDVLTLIKAKSSSTNRRVTRQAMCGQLGCSWCCLTSSGHANCRRFARCGPPRM